jgi:hypothetical protein
MAQSQPLLVRTSWTNPSCSLCTCNMSVKYNVNPIHSPLLKYVDPPEGYIPASPSSSSYSSPLAELQPPLNIDALCCTAMENHADGTVPQTHISELQMPNTPDRQTNIGSVLTCIYTNIQKSHENTSLLLERNLDADIIHIVKAGWFHIKNIPSSKCKDGNPYYGPVHHQNFICLGVLKQSQVATYINRKWANANPRIQPLG